MDTWRPWSEVVCVWAVNSCLLLLIVLSQDTMQRLLWILESIEKLERLLKIKQPPSVASGTDKSEAIESLTEK